MLLAATAILGSIAFHYATPLTPRELRFYSRFEVLVTHDPLPRAQVDALHKRGTRLVLYEWAVAFYASRRTSFDAQLPPSALLNAKPLRGYLGSNDADAYYYDPAASSRERALALSEKLRAIQYDGIFLDTTTSLSVHPKALEEYQRRHPDLPYDRAYAAFLAQLRNDVALIVTNQGYRRADDVLPYVDWDVSESLITHPVNGKFVLRPFDEIVRVMPPKYAGVRVAHINYIDKRDPKLIETIVAITKLFDADAVVALSDVPKTVQSELLLLDLGKSLRADETHRYFERGYVEYDPVQQRGRVVRDER